MSPAAAAAAVETTSCLGRFSDVRGVRWRIGLGILPSSSSTSIDDFRRVTADSRRRYASLRRQLLVDPHVPKEGRNSLDLVDNPLSQNPDSMWGRYFRNAELERIVDQDLSRLYPEHGSYFQTQGCQGMLRRILLIWCLRHPEYGYRQGMHEVLAPLLYVLHVDVQYLLEVRKLHEDYFTDKFDGFSCPENDSKYRFDFKNFSESMGDENDSEETTGKSSNFSVLDPKIQTVVLISDAYGAEGELGVVLSEKFMEHDAYCMFDALMNGAGGAVAVAEFFSTSPLGSSNSGHPAVIEASTTLYHLLSIVDSSVHSHLVALGVEPQYFALRWLRVLFGREFALEALLIVWDEIFVCENSVLKKSMVNDAVVSCMILSSTRGAFIAAFAVSMILHLRSSLLASENATSCLQRLLNFPEDINPLKLIEKAKSLMALAMGAIHFTPLLTHAGLYDGDRGKKLLDSASPRTPLGRVPDSYWEERWRVLHEEHKQGGVEKQVLNRKIGWSQKVRLQLSRTESGSSASKVGKGQKSPKGSVRRNLLEDLTEQLGSDEGTEKIISGEDLGQSDPVTCTPEQRCSTQNAACEESSSISPDRPIFRSEAISDDTVSERSVTASNVSVNGNDMDTATASRCTTDPGSPLPVSCSPEDISLKADHESPRKSVAGWKEQKLLSGKFQWLWKFKRQPSEEQTSERGGVSEAAKASSSVSSSEAANAPCDVPSSESAKAFSCVSSQASMADSSTSDQSDMPNGVSEGETTDENRMTTLRNLGQSMLENIQAIESAFQQENRGQAGESENFSKNVIAEKGQVTVVAALKELRKISNLLSEM